MIRRLSLSQRLALVVVSLLMLCAVAVCAVQLHSSAQYGNAMVQRLSSGLAQQIVAREPLLDAHGEVNRQTLKSLFDRLMTFNPSVELYLLSPDGDLLADAAPPGHIQRQRIDMAPVQAFLTGSASPVYGDDPRSPDGRKVFSAAPLRVDGQLRGYLYIILQGETFNQLAADAWQKTLWSIVLWISGMSSFIFQNNIVCLYIPVHICTTVIRIGYRICNRIDKFHFGVVVIVL